MTRRQAAAFTMATAVASTSALPQAAPQESQMSAATFKRLHPALYLSRYLAEGFRPDGRSIEDWRAASVNVGSISTASGSSLVRMGETTVVTGIKAEIAEPTLAAPQSGYIVPNVDLPALSSPRFKPGPPVDQAQALSARLASLLTRSNTVPLESLCIEQGKAVWVLYIDVVCINYDGNVWDAVVLGVMSALRNTRLPAAKFNPETMQTVCSRTESSALALGRQPLSASFGIFETRLLPDATALETDQLETSMSIALDEGNRVALVRQLGIAQKAVLDRCWPLAEQRVRVLRQLLDGGEE